MHAKLAGVMVAVGMLFAPVSAQAAKVGIGFDGGDIGVNGGYVPKYVAEPGEVNNPTVTVAAAGSAKVITFHDPSATISPDPPEGATACSLDDEHTARCLLPDPVWVQRYSSVPPTSFGALWAMEGWIHHVRIELGDRNDTYVPAPPPSLAPGNFVLEVDGGAGNDTVTNGPGPTWTSGGSGNDSIFARNGHAEFVMCGDGVDRVRSVDPDDDAWTDCESVAVP